jgi:hypothetical protein
VLGPFAALAQAPVLPGLDGSVCDFVAMNAGRTIGAPEAMQPKPLGSTYDWDKPFEALLTKRAIADVDGDGDVELLDIGASGGTAHGDVPTVFGADRLTGDLLPSHSRDDIRWAFGARWLQFGDSWHLVYFQDEQLEQAMAVDTVTGGGGLTCLFDYGFDEKIGYYRDDPAFAVAYQHRLTTRNGRQWREMEIATGSPLLNSDRLYLMSVGDGFREVEDSLRGEGRNREIAVHRPSAIILSDLDGDGAKERIARLNKSSGAGRGCDATFLELMPDEGKSEPDMAKRDLLRRAQGPDPHSFALKCGQRAELVEIAGRGYIYIESLGVSKRERRLVDGKGTWIARSEFTPRHAVTFDREKIQRAKPPN